jgi:membrane protein YdbS with pleckstrin-like domain
MHTATSPARGPASQWPATRLMIVWRMPADGPTYQATYRRAEVALPSLVGIVALFFAGLWLVLQHPTDPRVMDAILALVGAVVLAAFVILLTVFRVHRWTIEAGGVRISERPRVPLMGWGRRASVPFADILGVRRVESGFDHLLEIVASDGSRYRLPQRMVAAGAHSLPQPDPAADLDSFAAALHAAARQAGRELPASEGLSFWNTLPGIAFIVVLLVIACAIAAAVAWALWDGMTTSQPRGGYSAAIALLLPVGAGWLLLKTIRRRRFVLAAMKRKP